MNRAWKTSLVLGNLCVVAISTTACSDDVSGETEGVTFGTTDPFPQASDGTVTTGGGAADTDGPPVTTTAGDDAVTTTAGPADTTAGGADGCIASGQYTAQLVGRDDRFGHFSFLQFFYSPSTAENLVDEVFVVTVSPEGEVTIDFLPRDGADSGHLGASGLSGTIGSDCAVDIVSQAGWESDSGSFGTIDIELTGVLTQYQPTRVLPSCDITFSGGTIPNGPITYNVELTGE